MRVVPRMRSLGLALILALPGCSSTSPSDQVLGSYHLITVDGQALPFEVVIDADNRISFVSGTVTLSSDGMFGDVTTFSVTQNGQSSTQVVSAEGPWSLEGSTLQLSPSDSEPYTMIWNGSDRLTQNFDGFVLVYQR